MKFNILEQMECALRTHGTHTFVGKIQWTQYDGIRWNQYASKHITLASLEECEH